MPIKLEFVSQSRLLRVTRYISTNYNLKKGTLWEKRARKYARLLPAISVFVFTYLKSVVNYKKQTLYQWNWTLGGPHKRTWLWYNTGIPTKKTNTHKIFLWAFEYWICYSFNSIENSQVHEKNMKKNTWEKTQHVDHPRTFRYPPYSIKIPH